MDSTLTLALVVTAGAAAALAALVTLIKVIHRQILRLRGVRTAHYVAAVGEMVSRGLIPSDPPHSWAEDPYFHRVLADYRLLLTGGDRQFVDHLVDSLGVHPVLVRRTRSHLSQSRRLKALSSLVDLADTRHLEDLRKLVDDRNRHVRVNAVRGLSRLGDLLSIGRILDVAAQATPWEATRMADALAAMGLPARDPIDSWIAGQMERPDGSVSTVALAARVLGLIGDPLANPTLIALLASNQPDWRLAAASALGRTGGTEAVAPLLHASGDHSWRVRARAAVAIGALADSTAGPALARLLTDEVWWVRQNAADALGSLPGGTDHLLAALDSPDRFAADAALNQLTVSGVLGEATDRVARGRPPPAISISWGDRTVHELVPDRILGVGPRIFPGAAGTPARPGGDLRLRLVSRTDGRTVRASRGHAHLRPRPSRVDRRPCLQRGCRNRRLHQVHGDGVLSPFRDRCRQRR